MWGNGGSGEAMSATRQFPASAHDRDTIAKRVGYRVERPLAMQPVAQTKET